MSDGKQEVQVLHNWLWVIIPATHAMIPLLSAYCKNCQYYFTQFLQIPGNMTSSWNTEKYVNEINVSPDFYQTIYDKSKLPKWGCVNPMEGLGVA